MEQLVDITGVEVVGDHRLRLTFADGTVGELDFAERAWVESSRRSPIQRSSRARM